MVNPIDAQRIADATKLLSSGQHLIVINNHYYQILGMNPDGSLQFTDLGPISGAASSSTPTAAVAPATPAGTDPNSLFITGHHGSQSWTGLNPLAIVHPNAQAVQDATTTLTPSSGGAANVFQTGMSTVGTVAQVAGAVRPLIPPPLNLIRRTST
jgi:hypothetical protein